jgi:hypothetical protein
MLQHVAEQKQQALRAFRRDLDQLWADHPGQWAAYQGEKLIGFAPQQHEIYQRCFQQGLHQDAFVVFCIEPEETEITFGRVVSD